MSQPPPNYQSILLSEVYTIHAGPSHVPFTAHRELLCHHSPTIRTLVSSDSWTQSKSTTIWWEQWDPDTVSRFLEFLYTGQYTGPDLEVVPRDEEQDVLPLESDEQLEEESDEQPEEESAVSVSAEVTDTLSEKHERPITPITRFIQVVKPAELPVLNKEWAVALLETPGPGTINHLEQWSLAHAKIYAIALYTQVVPLAELALCHFVQGLSESTPRPLTNLVRYVYKHTDEKMRGILARWCVLEQKAFFGSEFGEAVKELVAEGGDFVVDLVGLMRRASDQNDRMFQASIRGYASQVKELKAESTELALPLRNLESNLRSMHSAQLEKLNAENKKNIERASLNKAHFMINILKSEHSSEVEKLKKLISEHATEVEKLKTESTELALALRLTESNLKSMHSTQLEKLNAENKKNIEQASLKKARFAINKLKSAHSSEVEKLKKLISEHTTEVEKLKAENHIIVGVCRKYTVPGGWAPVELENELRK